MLFKAYRWILVLLALILVSCGERSDFPENPIRNEKPLIDDSRCHNFNVNREALFGDLHVHTKYSFDAAANSTGATPEDAHRYARGEEIPFFPVDEKGVPLGRTKIDRPLDFLAVTDHGEFLGERALCRTPDSPMYDIPFCRQYRANWTQGVTMLGAQTIAEEPNRIPELCGNDGSLCREYARSPWQEIQAASNFANEPCAFTSFIGYEYTGTPGVSNYHRNVIFRSSHVPGLPVSYMDAPVDSLLWSSLDAVCDSQKGCDYITIPHNSNLANGRMAPYRKIADTLEARRDYAATRLQREPIMEIFQHKGASECINGLSSVFGAPDELCEIESVRTIGATEVYLVFSEEGGAQLANQVSEITEECSPGAVGSYGMLGAGCVHPTDYQRSALLFGLKEHEQTGLNPIKLGVIASTDTHSANAGGVVEADWGGAVDSEATPLERLGKPSLLTSNIDGNPGGLAGVWAEENTRDAIFDAMLRREVFGTSGPRIRPRIFAGWGLSNDLCEAVDMIEQAYRSAVPMGGDLVPVQDKDRKPSFLLHAAKDPIGRKLQSLQLIKGWITAEGVMHNEVITVADDPVGADSLCRVYVDEGFDANLSAYYYLRVAEPSSPRWHTFDCALVEESLRPPVCSDNSYPDTIREMAWTSPIWYTGNK